MDHLQSNIFIAGQRLNDLTGYSGIEALKKDIEQQEIHVQATRTSLQKAREDYTLAISQRSSSQREVNELLQRKHAWTPNDLERFTELYRSDHANEQAEAAAQENLLTIERRAEEAAAKLSASILARYHEEQIWSDKIRRMSTWGTWGLMGVNVLLFLVFQIGVEPWRRKRLVKGFEDKVMEALEREGSPVEVTPTEVQMAQGANSAEVQAAQEVTAPADIGENAQMPDAEDPLPEVPLPIQENIPSDMISVKSSSGSKLDIQTQVPMSTFESIKEWIRDMFSERQIVLRRVDVTTATLEGAAAGVAFVGVLVLLLRPR
ncbi:MAG: sensitivity to high expression protein she9 [Alectoria sarmentosa]|nr:MAG: sensitivity to high expression protein she9 [Alectoria sarmentosa]